MTTLLGPMLPFLSARWSLNDAKGGYLFTAQFLASILGVALSTYLTRQHKFRPALVIGLILMGAGAVLLARADWVLGVVAVCIYGTGQGVTVPAANLLIAELNPMGRAAALNLLNFSWGVGAVGSPLVIHALQDFQSLYLYSVGGLLGLSAVSMLWVPVPQQPISQAQRATRPTVRVVWWSRFVLILGILFFSYVGTENAVGGWIASYAQRSSTGAGSLWTMTPAFFWGALLCGRAIAPRLLRRMDETKLSTCGIALAALGIFFLLITHSTIGISVTAMAIGLGLSSLYPAYIAMLSHWFGEASVRVGGLMFSLASLGGASLPWLVGVLSTQFGSLRAGLMLPFVSTLVMLVLYVIFGSYRPIAQSLTQAASS